MAEAKSTTIYQLLCFRNCKSAEMKTALLAAEIKESNKHDRMKYIESQIKSFEKDLGKLDDFELSRLRTYKSEYQEVLLDLAQLTAKRKCISRDTDLFLIVPDEPKNFKWWGIPVSFGYSKEVLEFVKQRKDACLSCIISTPGDISLRLGPALKEMGFDDVIQHVGDNLVFFGVPREYTTTFPTERATNSTEHATNLTEHAPSINVIGTVTSDFVRRLLA